MCSVSRLYETVEIDTERVSRYVLRKHVRSHDFSTYADLCCSRETRSAWTVTPAAKLSISKNRSTLYRLCRRYLLTLSAVYWQNSRKYLVIEKMNFLFKIPRNFYKLIGSIAQLQRATYIFFKNNRGVK